MKGATAVPCVKTMNTPKIKRTKITGNNQIFFLLNKKKKNSFKNSFIKTVL